MDKTVKAKTVAKTHADAVGRPKDLIDMHIPTRKPFPEYEGPRKGWGLIILAAAMTTTKFHR